jgi:hypothetical protein
VTATQRRPDPKPQRFAAARLCECSVPIYLSTPGAGQHCAASPSPQRFCATVNAVRYITAAGPFMSKQLRDDRRGGGGGVALLPAAPLERASLLRAPTWRVHGIARGACTSRPDAALPVPAHAPYRASALDVTDSDRMCSGRVTYWCFNARHVASLLYAAERNNTPHSVPLPAAASQAAPRAGAFLRAHGAHARMRGWRTHVLARGTRVGACALRLPVASAAARACCRRLPGPLCVPALVRAG